MHSRASHAILLYRRGFDTSHRGCTASHRVAGPFIRVCMCRLLSSFRDQGRPLGDCDYVRVCMCRLLSTSRDQGRPLGPLIIQDYLLSVRPPLNKKLFPVHRPGGLKRAYRNFFFHIFKKKIFFYFPPCTF